MLFNTPLFLWFFGTFFVLYSFVLWRHRPRLLLILVGSLVFYAGWNYRFIPLLVASGVVDYCVGLGLEAETRERRRRWLLAASVATNLGILGAFKYSGFVLESVAQLARSFGYEPSLPTLSIVLPVGISFYTFQSMSYTIDVYRGHMRARRGLLQFVAALAFFPQLVAGPILRASHILPQLERLPVPRWDGPCGARYGLVLITAGLVKKSLADLLAAPVAAAFDSAGPVGTLEAWTGAIAFAGQIYGDFSGYSDIAIGLGLLLGFQIPLNFRLPYLATSPIDFWRRWHISLSSWLRDYLYIPLGGNRRRRSLNLMLTMLLGGLWHGASWTFVAWGGYHGALLVAQRALERVPSLAAWAGRGDCRARLPRIALTFYLVVLGWVPFRAHSLADAESLLLTMHAGGVANAASGVAGVTAVLSAVTLVILCAIDASTLRLAERRGGEPRHSRLFWMTLALGQGFAILMGESGHAFLYFQF